MRHKCPNVVQAAIERCAPRDGSTITTAELNARVRELCPTHSAGYISSQISDAAIGTRGLLERVRHGVYRRREG